MAIRDEYMNFFPMEVTFGADASNLVVENHNAAMGQAIDIGWEIHNLESFPPLVDNGTSIQLDLAVSSRKGLATMPDQVDKGCLWRGRVGLLWQTSGGTLQVLPNVYKYLPPVLLGTPNLSLYAQASASHASYNNKVVQVRLGFTMIALEKGDYQELWQTWNFSS